MPSATSTLKHQINISAINATLIPTQRVAWNQFDEHASLVSLPRNKGEVNWHYKRRILNALVDYANSSYRGLINGITRELGLDLFDALIINPKVGPDDRFIASDPYIIFDGVWLYLYSDYENNKLDYKIDRFEPGGNYEHLQRMIDFINTTSLFEAAIIPGVDGFTKSMTVINQSNRKTVPESGKLLGEAVPVSDRFQLENTRVVPGTLYFSNRNVYKQEVSSIALIKASGDYYVDYHNGIVQSYDTPELGVTARYSYTAYPFTATASPIIVQDINNDNFKVKMFKQLLQDDGTYSHGQPTALGVSILNELYSVFPTMWGA